MLTLACSEQIHLPSAWRERPRILAADSEEDQLSHIAEIEPNAAAIRSTIFSDLVPNNIGFVIEAPRLHHREPFRQQGVRTPQVKMRGIGCDIADRQHLDFIELHRAVARQALVLRRNLSGFVCELPWRIGQDRCELSNARKL